MIPQAVIAEKALNSKATPYLIGGGLLLGIGGIALVYFKIYKPILCKVGLMDCNEKDIKNVMKYKGLNPKYGLDSETTMSVQRAIKLAFKIKEAGGTFKDNVGDFYSVLEEAGSSHNLSLIARMFTAKKLGSLSEHLTYYLDEKNELDRVKEIFKAYKE